MSKVIQVRLRSETTERVCWVEDEKITLGCKVTLKGTEDPGTLWEVTQLGESRELKAVNKGWKVGGL